MAEKIVSPGVFTREIDLSFLPKQVQAIGSAIVGPTPRGPALVPTPVSTYADYLRIFGDSFSSGSGTDEVENKYLTSYAAQEYLRYGEVTHVVRTLAGSYAAAKANVVAADDIGAGDDTEQWNERSVYCWSRCECR
jgi:hypothetical protein